MNWLSLLVGIGLGVLLDYFLPRDWSIGALIVIIIAIVTLPLLRSRRRAS